MAQVKLYTLEGMPVSVVDFGKVRVGETKTVPLILKNEGRNAVENISIVVGDEAMSINSKIPNKLKPKQAVNVKVSWKPTEKTVRASSKLIVQGDEIIT